MWGELQAFKVGWINIMSRSNPYKSMFYFWLPFQLWRLVTHSACNIISNGFLFCISRKLYFHFWSKRQAVEIEIAYFHSLGNPKGRTLDHFFIFYISVITSPTNWYLCRWVSWNISEVINENSTSAFNYLDDFRVVSLAKPVELVANLNAEYLLRLIKFGICTKIE